MAVFQELWRLAKLISQNLVMIRRFAYPIDSVSDDPAGEFGGVAGVDDLVNRGFLVMSEAYRQWAHTTV